jgi:hypothetical protein
MGVYNVSVCESPVEPSGDLLYAGGKLGMERLLPKKWSRDILSADVRMGWYIF